MTSQPTNINKSGPAGHRMPLLLRVILITLSIYFVFKLVMGCHGPMGPGDPELTKNVHIELVDWHIVGLWVMNCPCGWVRVANYNHEPVKNVRIRYKTFGYKGELLNEGIYTLSGATPADAVVKAGSVKNFIEQYMGLVDLESDMLSIELVSVDKN